MILVTGAAGKTGRAVIEALVARHAPVRAMVRRQTQVAALRALGAEQVVVGDLLDEHHRRNACDGAQSIYHICPNVHPEEVAIGEGMIAAARDAGVTHLVYHSVLYPQIEAMPHHWHKLRVEEQLLTSGLGFTILQPAAYMQNLAASWPSMADDGVLRVPYPPRTPMTLVDLRDVAQVAAKVLTEPGHRSAIYPLCGAEEHTHYEIAALVGRQLAKPVVVEPWPLPEWRDRAIRAGLDDWQVETLCAMFRYYEEHGFCGNARTLHTLLGRAPATLATFVARRMRDSSSPDARD